MNLLRSSLRAVAVVALSSAALLVAVQGCSSSDNPPSSTKPSDAANQVIGAKGGTVTTPSGNASVDIPEGALPGDTTISITPVTAPPPAGTDGIGDAYVFGPEGLVFLKPVTVTLAYRTDALAGRDANRIVVYSAPVGTQQYAPLSTQPKDASHVAAIAMHFSVHIAAVDAPVDDASVDDGSTTDGGTDAGSDCYVKCSNRYSAGDADADGGGPPDVGCDCVARCAGKKYALACDGNACTCKTDGVQTATTTPSGGTCGDPTIARNAYKIGCGYPGDVPPATSPCKLDCTYAPFGEGGADGGAGGGPLPGPCGCTSSCSGHTYALDCTTTACTCTKDGVGASLAETTACANPPDDFTFGCNFPGAFESTVADAAAE
jgi:hypothetical protein